MLLQSPILPSPNSLSSPSGSPSIKTLNFPIKTLNFPIKTLNFSIKCSISQVDYEKRPMMKWKNVYRRISLMKQPEMGADSVLNQFESEGKVITKWEICRIVRELRKFKKFKLALQVYEWMNNRIERFRLSSSDTAIQLDLIAKVHGIASAEDYFSRLPDTLKDKRIYGALLNAYVSAKSKSKAESLMERMRNKGYAMHPLPFNVMMTLYMKLKEYDNVEKLVSEMNQKNIQLDLYSYNIWLSARGSCGSSEGMEQVFEQMKLDPTLTPNWTTLSIMAAMYIRLGQIEKAEWCLRNLENRINRRDRTPFHYLISLYGSLGNKGEIYRVWDVYKTSFPTIPNWGYHAVISSLVRVDDIEGAKRIYEEWIPVKPTYDPRIGNLLLSWYVEKGLFEEAMSFFNHMNEAGGKPNTTTWEILAEGHIKETRISDALSCFEKAFSVEGAQSWKPKPVNAFAFLDLCEREGDMGSKEVFIALLRKSGSLEDETYRSLLNGYIGIENSQDNENITNERKFDSDISDEDREEEESEFLLSVTD